MGKKICVLIPYFNAGQSLLETINSIDDVFMPDVLIVDDGSDHLKAAEVLEKYNGPLNIHLIEESINRGIEHALNIGLEYCWEAYDYIARLDCGDLCVDSRIEKQSRYLDANPDVWLVGSWVEWVDAKGNYIFTLRHPERHDAIRKKMCFNSAFTHPAVMFRSDVVESVGFYPTDYPAAEDYAFFFKILAAHECANIQESLVKCVVDPLGISSVSRKRQIKSRLRIMVKNFRFGAYPLIGIMRSMILLHTPRSFTIWVNKLLGGFRY